MKVLHINRNYLTSSLHQVMLNHLDGLESEHVVFAPTDNAGKAIVKPNSNVIVSECFSNLDRYFYYHKQRKILSAIEKNIKVREFDCIHAYTLFTDGNCAYSLNRKYGIPYIVAVRNTDVNDFFRRLPFLRQRGIEILKNARKIFFLSESYKEEVFRKYICAEDSQLLESRIEIIPNGIDDFWINERPKQVKSLSDKHLIKLVYAGRIDRNKNIPTMQKAMELLREEGIIASLTIVGKIDDKNEFKRIIEDKHTEYIEPQPKEKLIDIYRQSDIFVMPSFTESFGLVYAEAMSQGLPVIYTRGQGFDRQFEEGVVGYHVTASSPRDVADNIVKILENYDCLAKNVVACSHKFNWNDISERYQKIYETLI